MDVEVTFRTNDNIQAISDFSSVSKSFNPSLLGSQSSSYVLDDEECTKSPIDGGYLRWVSASAAILATFAAAMVGHLFLTKGQFVEQAMPDAVALLVFLLASRPR